MKTIDHTTFSITDIKLKVGDSKHRPDRTGYDLTIIVSIKGKLVQVVGLPIHVSKFRDGIFKGKYGFWYQGKRFESLISCYKEIKEDINDGSIDTI